MTENTEKLLSQDTVKAKFSKSIDLPILPQVGKQLVELKSRESFDLVDLVDLIERDPVISAKIISYASSPFFSYQGKLDSVQEAVFHVLGVDLSMNIALALAMGHEFNGPLNGPLGAMAVWRHGVYCATLSQAIASKISGVANVKPGTAYLYGLLHNIGFLALGHMFPEQFATFNRMVESKPDVSISVLEKQILGVSHTMVGGLLMGSWNLPEDFKTIIENHHNYDINSNEQVYAHIIHIANVMLKTINIGDAGDPYLPEELIEKYKLKEGELQRLLENVSRWNESLDSLAQQMVA